MRARRSMSSTWSISRARKAWRRASRDCAGKRGRAAMRDVVLTAFLFGSLPFILWRPAYGVFLWVWVSVMSPHRLAWGFAYDFKFAQLIAIATLLGLIFSRQPKHLPVTPVTVVLFAMILWMNITTV